MTARFWSCRRRNRQKTLTAAVAPRIVEASIALGRLRAGAFHQQGGERNLIERLRGPVVIIDRLLIGGKSPGSMCL